MDAIDDIAAERRRQIEAEGWTPEHDDEHDDGSLAEAAAAYALNGSGHYVNAVDIWPWDRSWWKPKERRADLVRAGALIVAEIERLDRTPNPSGQSETTAKEGECSSTACREEISRVAPRLVLGVAWPVRLASATLGLWLV